MLCHDALNPKLLTQECLQVAEMLPGVDVGPLAVGRPSSSCGVDATSKSTLLVLSREEGNAIPIIYSL